MKKTALCPLNYFVRVLKLASAVFILAAYTISNCSSAQAHSSKAKGAASPANTRVAMVADKRTRALVRHIQADQIASLQFIDLLYGPATPLSMPTMDASNQIVRTDFEPIVTDHRLISEFLRALRHAYKTKGVILAYARPLLRITFRKSGHFQREPLDITINSEYLGPEFQSVLNKVPGYLAAQLHHKMQTLDSQVREVDFATIKVTDPRKVAQIIKALKQVKQNAFSVYGNTRDTFGLSLRLRQGGSEDIVFVIDTPPSSNSGSLSLPRTLWNYYKQVENQAPRN